MNSGKGLGFFRDLALLFLILAFISLHRSGPIREYWRERDGAAPSVKTLSPSGIFPVTSALSDASGERFRRALEVGEPKGDGGSHSDRVEQLLAAAGPRDRSLWAGPALFEAAETSLYSLGAPREAAALYERAAKVLGPSPLGTSSLVAAALCRALTGSRAAAESLLDRASTGLWGKHLIHGIIEKLKDDFRAPPDKAHELKVSGESRILVKGPVPESTALPAPAIRLLDAGRAAAGLRDMLGSIAGSGGLEEVSASMAMESCRAVSDRRCRFHAPGLDGPGFGEPASGTEKDPGHGSRCRRRVLLVTGSNNYHHASGWAMAGQIPTMAPERTILVNIDQHTDLRDDGRWGLDCGNWIGRLLGRQALAGLILLGQTVRETPQRDSGIWLGLSSRGDSWLGDYGAGSYSFFPDNAPVMFLAGRNPPPFETQWARPDWNLPGLAPRGFRFRPTTWRRALETGKVATTLDKGEFVYLSVDLDVLTRDLVETDWGNGTMTLAELERVIVSLSRGRTLSGASVTGVRFSGDAKMDERSLTTMKSVCIMLLEAMGGDDERE